MTVAARVEAEVVEMVQMEAVLVRIEGVVVEMEAVVVGTSRDGRRWWTSGGGDGGGDGGGNACSRVPHPIGLWSARTAPGRINTELYASCSRSLASFM